MSGEVVWGGGLWRGVDDEGVVGFDGVEGGAYLFFGVVELSEYES